jgi:hypothetical protein
VYDLCISLLSSLDHLTSPGLLFNILLVLAKASNGIINLTIQGQWFENSSSRRCFLLPDQLAEFGAKYDNIQTGIGQGLDQAGVLVCMVDPLVITW